MTPPPTTLRPTPPDWGAPNWRYWPERRFCRLEWPGLDLRLDLQDWRHEKNELVGLLGVFELASGRLVAAGALAAENPRARSGRATHLRDLYGDVPGGWVWLLEDFALRLMLAERATREAEADWKTPAATSGSGWLRIHNMPYRLPRNAPTIYFGDGGAGKSYVALDLALRAVDQGERVLFADWENSESWFRHRLHRLCQGEAAPPGGYYVSCHRPLVDEVSRLQHLITKRDVTLIICDSINAGSRGAPEEAEHALAYMNAVRALGKTALLLAHRSKADQDGGKPFGSVCYHNAARLVVFLRQAKGADPNVVDLGLFERKNNDGARQPPEGLRIHFDANTQGAVTIIRTPLAASLGRETER